MSGLADDASAAQDEGPFQPVSGPLFVFFFLELAAGCRSELVAVVSCCSGHEVRLDWLLWFKLAWCFAAREQSGERRVQIRLRSPSRGSPPNGHKPTVHPLPPSLALSVAL